MENERDDLMVEVVDLKETIEGLNNEKHTLEEKVSSTEEENDDLLVICTDLKETIDGLNREHRLHNDDQQHSQQWHSIRRSSKKKKPNLSQLY